MFFSALRTPYRSSLGSIHHLYLQNKPNFKIHFCLLWSFFPLNLWVFLIWMQPLQLKFPILDFIQFEFIDRSSSPPNLVHTIYRGNHLQRRIDLAVAVQRYLMVKPWSRRWAHLSATLLFICTKLIGMTQGEKRNMCSILPLRDTIVKKKPLTFDIIIKPNLWFKIMIVILSYVLKYFQILRLPRCHCMFCDCIWWQNYQTGSEVLS